MLVHDERYIDKSRKFVAQKVTTDENATAFRVCKFEDLTEYGVFKRVPVVVALFTSKWRLLVWSVLTFGGRGVLWVD